MILLDEARTLSLLNGATGSIPLLLVASIDAYSPTVYTKVKGFDRLNLVRQNLRRLLRMRRDLNLRLTYNFSLLCRMEMLRKQGTFIRTGSIHSAAMEPEAFGTMRLCSNAFLLMVGHKDNKRQMICTLEQFYNRDSVMKSSMEFRFRYGSVNHGSPPKNRLLMSKRMACPALWSTPVIRHDGALMLCCADLEGQMTLGNLQDNRFSELWLSEPARKRRREHLAGHFNDKCLDCGG